MVVPSNLNLFTFLLLELQNNINEGEKEIEMDILKSQINLSYSTLKTKSKY